MTKLTPKDAWRVIERVEQRLPHARVSLLSGRGGRHYIEVHGGGWSFRSGRTRPSGRGWVGRMVEDVLHECAELEAM